LLCLEPFLASLSRFGKITLWFWFQCAFALSISKFKFPLAVFCDHAALYSNSPKPLGTITDLSIQISRKKHTSKPKKVHTNCISTLQNIIKTIFELNFKAHGKKKLIKGYSIAKASLSWKSLYSNFPPSGTLLQNISIDIRHKPLPFIKNLLESTEGRLCLKAIWLSQTCTSSLCQDLGSKKSHELFILCL